MSTYSLNNIEWLEAPEPDAEREAFVKLDPSGFFIRHPPKPHELESFITPDDQLFQTIHMGAAVVEEEKWMLVINGLVQNPLAVTLDTLRSLPNRTFTSFHECYGSPLKPATTALWRIGNVRWTGVPLNELLKIAQPLPSASFVWSEGLDRGEFAGVEADRYQKDLPIGKAMSDEVMLAYEINGEPLPKNRGGPVRLVVPGWFGTNSTKWLSKLTLQNHRATGPYTTTFYNEPDPAGPEGALRPVWEVEPNSMIVRPKPEEEVAGPKIKVRGWAWHCEPIEMVEVSVDEGLTWQRASVGERVDFSWQRFWVVVSLGVGSHSVMAKATTKDGISQSLGGRRNHCHKVSFVVVDG